MNKFTRWRNICLAISAILIALILLDALGGSITLVPPLFILLITCLACGYACEATMHRENTQMLHDKQSRYIIVNTMLADISVTKLDAPSENTGERIILFDD